MSNVLSLRRWLAVVVGVSKLCHGFAIGGQKSAWRGLWKEIPWPDRNTGAFHISIRPGDGLCTARQACLSHPSGNAVENW